MAFKRLRSMTFPGLTDTYTVPQEIIDLEDFTDFASSAIAIISTNDTHIAIPKDLYVYVKEHDTLQTGLYQNISGSTIAANASLDSSNVQLVSGGALNSLKTSLTLNQGNIATVESGSSATQNYSVGDLVIVGGLLYSVTSAITSGNTFVVGQNIKATTVENEYKTSQLKTDFTTISGITRTNGGYYKIGRLVVFNARFTTGSSDVGLNGHIIIDNLPSASDVYGDNSEMGAIMLSGMDLPSNLTSNKFPILSYIGRAVVYATHTEPLLMPANTVFAVSFTYVCNA